MRRWLHEVGDDVMEPVDAVGEEYTPLVERFCAQAGIPTEAGERVGVAGSACSLSLIA
ncbi:hypothetical protein ACL02S_22210 [Nocardia sp. 004]|uniref:hypothetical protein n=1 Tax=Nocardia sp. 004 TaxID=3385978 RepID=UPI0039A1AED4